MSAYPYSDHLHRNCEEVTEAPPCVAQEGVVPTPVGPMLILCGYAGQHALPCNGHPESGHPVCCFHYEQRLGSFN